MATTVWIMTHVGRPAEASQASRCHRRGVCVSVHLERRTDKKIDSILARKLGEDFWVGLEYYTALGPIGNFLPFSEQEHNIYGVVDFKVGNVDVNFGVGYGLTGGSDRWMTKLIIGTELNDPNIGASRKK